MLLFYIFTRNSHTEISSQKDLDIMREASASGARLGLSLGKEWLLGGYILVVIKRLRRLRQL